MSSQIRFKFRSQTAYDLLQFDGHGITVGEVKVMIAERKGLGSDAIPELVLHNPTLKLDYDDDSKQLLKNTSVVVKRVPASQRPLRPLVGATPAPAAAASTLASTSPQPDSFTDAAAAGGIHDGGEPGIHTDDTGPVVPANVQAFIENAAKGIFSSDQLNTQQQAGGRGGRGGGRWGGPGGRGGGRSAPPTYVCSRCGGLGHFLTDCPTVGDAAFDKRFRHPSGIPVSKIQRNADGSLFLPDGEAGEMAPNRAAFQDLADMLPNAARTTPEFNTILPDAASTAASSNAGQSSTTSNPSPGNATASEAGMFMPSLVLPPSLPKAATHPVEAPASTAPDTFGLGLFPEDDEQQAPFPHASLALGMSATADLASTLLPPPTAANANQAFPPVFHRHPLNASMPGARDDLLGMGYDMNTFINLLPALEPVIPKAPIKYLAKLFASGRPLTALEFQGLQQSIGNAVPAASERERKHTSKPEEVTVKREEKKKRRHASRSPSPGSLAQSSGGSKLTHRRSGDSNEPSVEPAPMDQRQRRREDAADDRREFHRPLQMQPHQGYEQQHMDPRFDSQSQGDRYDPHSQDFRGNSSLQNRYSIPQQEFRSSGATRGSRQSEFAPHPGPFRQQPPPPAREGRAAQERDARMTQDWDDSRTLPAESSRPLLQQRETRFAERDGSRAQQVRAPSPPLTRRPSSSSFHSQPKVALPSQAPATTASVKTQHAAGSSQRVKQEPDRERDRPTSSKALPPSSKRYSSPTPTESPARSPVRSPARGRASKPSKQPPSTSRSRSPVRPRSRSDNTERWQAELEQSAVLEDLPVRVPRTASSPADSQGAAAPVVQASNPGPVTAEPGTAEDQGQGKENGIEDGGLSRWGDGAGEDGFEEQDFQDEGMEEPQGDLLHSRAHEQQQGSGDGLKREGTSLRVSSPSSTECPEVYVNLHAEPSDERKHERPDSGREARSESPVGQGTTTVSDRKSSKRHKRHKEGKDHKQKHKSKRHKSASPLASSPTPPVVRDPSPEPEQPQQSLPQATHEDRKEKRKHHHKSSSSRHKSDRQDGDRKRADKESERDSKRQDRAPDPDGKQEERGSGSGRQEQQRSASQIPEDRDDRPSRHDEQRHAPEFPEDKEVDRSRREPRHSDPDIVKEERVRISKSDRAKSPTDSKSKHRSSSRRA